MSECGPDCEHTSIVLPEPKIKQRSKHTRKRKPRAKRKRQA